LCAFLLTYVCIVFIFADTKLKILGLAGFALISSTVNLIALKIEEANKVVKYLIHVEVPWAWSMANLIGKLKQNTWLFLHSRNNS
jgi:hypothetical protein